MVVIAAVNLVTCLIILVLERTKMIGTLKAVGAPDTLLQKVFLFNTFKIALRGILIGAIVGLLICYIQQFTGFIKLNEKEYYIDKAEVLIHYGQVIAIMLGTLIVCMVTLIIPTLIIRKVNIVKAITFR
jgi:lipoprotein-releasing system permease protein